MSKKPFRYSRIKYLFTIACFWAGFSFITSCNDNSGVGSNVLPASVLHAHYGDTATIRTVTFLKDSLVTNGVTTWLLGSYTDPIFGKCKASVYSQVLLPNSAGFTFTPGYVFDSVILRMPFSISATYGNHYGNFSPQTVQVYEIAHNDSLRTNKAYYSDTTIGCNAQPIGQQTMLPSPSQFVLIRYKHDTTYYAPEIWVKLNKSWGQNFFNAAASNFASNTAFLEYFRGLYITVNNPLQLPGQGAISYLDPTVTGGGLFFYYHSSTGDTEQYAQFQLGGGGTVYFNHFDHDYSGTELAGKHDTIVTPEVSYIQAMAGPKVKIYFPYLKNWVKSQRIIINKAEVEIPIENRDADLYAPPDQMYLVGSTAYDTAFALPDQSLPYYGGTYDPTNKVYVFDIDRYIQSVLDGKTIDHGLFLLDASPVTANRVTVYGGTRMSPTGTRMRLKLYYTPLKS